MMKKSLLFAFVVLSAFMFGCSSRPETEAGTAKLPRVDVKEVTRKTLAREIALTGAVEPFEEVTLHARAEGYLKTIRVDRGDWVKKGDLLAEIDSPDLVQSLAETEAEHALKRTLYEKLATVQRESPDMVSEMDIEKAKGERDAARAKFERLTALRAYLFVHAPFAGVITERFVHPGALIRAGSNATPLLHLMNTDPVRVMVDVPDSEASFVREGTRARVLAADSSGEALEGKVTRFSWALHPSTRMMRAEVHVPNPKNLLRAGGYVKVSLEIAADGNALTVPASAVYAHGGKAHVFVVREGRLAETSVALGFDDGVTVEVREGLTESDAVVVSRGQGLKGGMAVEAAPAK
jgi:RND family efflux transporter MFP subunit